MTQNAQERPSLYWKILSTYVKTRDGPYRLEQVYRLLLLPKGYHEVEKSTAHDWPAHVRKQGGA